MRLRRHLKSDPPTPEAAQALDKAKHDLAEAKERAYEVDAVVKKIRRYGDRNNFAEMIREALGGSR